MTSGVKVWFRVIELICWLWYRSCLWMSYIAVVRAISRCLTTSPTPVQIRSRSTSLLAIPLFKTPWCGKLRWNIYSISFRTALSIFLAHRLSHVELLTQISRDFPALPPKGTEAASNLAKYSVITSMILQNWMIDTKGKGKAEVMKARGELVGD